MSQRSQINELLENLELLRGKPVTFKMEIATHKGPKEVTYKGDLLKGDKVYDAFFSADKVEIATSKMPSNIVFGLPFEFIDDIVIDTNQLVINNTTTLSW
jgi:hypothetical protein